MTHTKKKDGGYTMLSVWITVSLIITLIIILINRANRLSVKENVKGSRNPLDSN